MPRSFQTQLFTNKYASFAFELGVPESIADFFEGRTPKTIGAKHYMILLRQAKQYYQRYAEYIKQLRQKALN